jgi:peptide/nickel transport system ATP-binding protein
VPPLRKLSDGHLVACHWAEEIKAGRLQPHEREAVLEPGPQEAVPEPPPV